MLTKGLQYAYEVGKGDSKDNNVANRGKRKDNYPKREMGEDYIKIILKRVCPTTDGDKPHPLNFDN